MRIGLLTFDATESRPNQTLRGVLWMRARTNAARINFQGGELYLPADVEVTFDGADVRLEKLIGIGGSGFLYIGQAD